MNDAHLLEVARAVGVLDAGVDVDRPRAHGADGVGDVVGGEAAGEDRPASRTCVDDLAADRPVVRLAGGAVAVGGGS